MKSLGSSGSEAVLPVRSSLSGWDGRRRLDAGPSPIQGKDRKYTYLCMYPFVLLRDTIDIQIDFTYEVRSPK